MRTHYKNLKVGENATQEEIKSAYKSLVQKWHPDKNEDKKLASRNFRIIKRSYDILSNEDKRAKHDAWIKKKREKEVYDIALVITARNLIKDDEEENPLGFWGSMLKEFGAKGIVISIFCLCLLLAAIGYNIKKAFEGHPIAIGVIVLIAAHLAFFLSAMMED